MKFKIQNEESLEICLLSYDWLGVGGSAQIISSKLNSKGRTKTKEKDTVRWNHLRNLRLKKKTEKKLRIMFVNYDWLRARGSAKLIIK